MLRYSVTIVSPGTAGQRLVLLVPFQPTAFVTAFVDEIWKRISRQGIPLERNTHIATLHLDSETGAIVDVEDVLSDVVIDPKNEKLFAVFTEKADRPSQEASINQAALPALLSGTTEGEETVSIRVITTAQAKDRGSCPVLRVPIRSTIRHLHDSIAEHLCIRPKFDEDAEVLECNCKLANLLADDAGSSTDFLVVHGKSIVERVPLSNPTETAVNEKLRERFGVDVESRKRVVLVGADVDFTNPNRYKKLPVAAICSRQRHAPTHARVEIDESGQSRWKILDLHTSELPIHPACMSSTIEDASLSALAVDGVIDIFVVNRTTSGNDYPVKGKSSIFRSRARWEPRVLQSDRGIAMFLSSLRVFASLVQGMRDDERSQDAVLHVLDLLTNFSPAVRAFQILIQKNTPTPAESAAISHAMFEVLDSFMPTDIIGSDHSRVFEGARLLFGFILEKARTLKIPMEEGFPLPYLDSFQTVDLRDYKTQEAVLHAVQTSSGLIEASLFNALQEGGHLVDSRLQTFVRNVDSDPKKVRQALLSGGTAAEVTVHSASDLLQNYKYRDSGNVAAAIDLDELLELSHLAELCGRNKLAVHYPSQLASAVAPCLTFDRNALLAVYTGEQPCGNPGHSSILFRPMHGEETINAAVVEQLIAPIMKHYSDDGTAVFDTLGGAAVRRLQAPDEILYFCVDTSASMRQPTDFVDVDDEEPLVSEDSDAQSYVDAQFYNRASLDEMKEGLCSNEGFLDMIAIIAATTYRDKRVAASDVLKVLRTMLSADIIKKVKHLESREQYARGWYYARQQVADLKSELDKLKTLWAGLKTHEDALCDFLVYRATTSSSDISQRWAWSLGDDTPTATSPQHIPNLAAEITVLPHNLRCPISHSLMEDAVVAVADGQTYSHSAIRQWFDIRKSSPMTGLQVDDTTLNSNQEICDAVLRWISGGGIPGCTEGKTKRIRFSNKLHITFDSRVGSFQRWISSSMTLNDLYKLAFRGLKAKFVSFQLSTERYGPLIPSSGRNISSCNIRNGDHITIRIADEEPTTSVSNNGIRSELVLVKVYEHINDMTFGYWVKKDTTATLASVLWKHLRYTASRHGYVELKEKQIWTDMDHSGDNLLSGRPQENTDRLSMYLTRAHCFGVLGAEKVYREGPGNNGVDGPLVLKISIGEAHEQHNSENSRLSRLEVLKQMFEALINRMLAYNYKTHVGLITFASTCQVAMGVSHVLENFRRTTSDMTASGDTALWDSISLALDQVVEYGKKYPDAKKRIIVISDGADTKSINQPEEICWRLQQASVAVDTISLGYEKNKLLRTIPTMLGCYHFHPTSLVNALAICEMEPFLSLTERPSISPPRDLPSHRLQYMGYFWKASRHTKTTVVTSDSVPPRKEHPNMHDEFVELSSATARPRNTTSSGTSHSSNLRISRLMNEMKLLVNSEHPTYDVYVSETDMSYWKVVMSGPEDSPYEDGVFLLYIHADEGYPTFAPKARFITKIKHPNVNMHGRICHSIFDRDWTSDIKMTDLLDTIYSLLYQPEHSDPVNTATTLGFHHDQVEFADEVREHVSRYASMTREEWKNELL